MFKNRGKVVVLICSIFFVAIGFNSASGRIQQQLKAEETKQTEETMNQVPVGLQSTEQLEIPDEMVMPDGQRLPLVTPSLGARALNGSKIDTPSTIVNPVIFIEFADDTGEWVTAENLAKIDSIYNTGSTSLNSYYKKMSYGNVNVVSEFYPKEMIGGDVYFDSITPFKSSYPRGYILPKSVSNPVGYDPAVEESTELENSYRYHELKVLEEVLSSQTLWSSFLTTTVTKEQVLNTKFTSKFSYDWTFPLATDMKYWEDISLDSMTFVLRGSMNADKNNQILWPHKFKYTNCNAGQCAFNQGRLPTSLVNGKAVFEFVDNYAVVTADNNTDLFSNDPDIGVVTHEFLHQFNAPDLYRLTNKGMAVGKWDLMGWQQKTPQHFLQYTNSMFGIWRTPDFEVLNSTQDKADRMDRRVALAQYNQADYIVPTAYKIVPKDTSKNEYFMVESRKKTASGFENDIEGSGLLVYRIHENTPSTIGGAFCGITCGNMGTNMGSVGYAADEVFVFRPNAESASLATASMYDPNLEFAAFPRTLNGTKINSIGKSLTDVPVSAGFQKDTLYFSDGTNSGIRIVEISDQEANGGITFSVLYDEEAYTVDEEAPTIDEASLSGDALGSSWVKPDQEISVNLADNVGLKEIMIFTTDGMMLDTEGNETQNILLSFDTVKTSETLKFKVRSNGTYSIFVMDTSENLSDTVEFEVSKIDGVVPTLSFQTSGADSTLSLDFTSEDAVSGIKEASLKYVYLEVSASEDNLTYDQTYQGTPITLGANFYKKVCAKVEDNAGNIGKKCQVIGSEDTTPPSVGTITYNPTSWSKDDVVMNVPVSDNQGVKSIQVTTTDGKLVKDNAEVMIDLRTLSGSDTSKTEDFIVRKNGTYMILVSDASGNSNASGDNQGQSVTITKIDKEVPIIDTFTYQLNASSKMEVSATSLDKPTLGNSGVKEIQYQYQDDPLVPLTSTWTTFTSPMETTKDNTYTGKFCLRSEDQAGNYSEVSCKSFRSSDQSNPVLESNIDNLVDINTDSSGWTKNASIALVLHASDADSGIKSIEVTLNGSAVGTKYETTQVVKTYDYELNITENGTYDVVILDQEDNELRTTFVVNQLDREKPIIDGTTNSEVSLFFIFPTNDLDVSFTNHDMPISSNSGVKEIYYQLVATGGNEPVDDVTDSSWTKISPTDEVRVSNGYEGTLYAYALDNAGNQSALYEEEIKNNTPSQSDDATLSSVSLSNGTLSPSFSANTTTYTASVANSITSINMTALANHGSASITGDANQSLPLTVGSNTFTILVSAEDGTTKTYSFTITRAAPSAVASSDATLSSLTLSSGALSPSFSASTIAYSASVANSVTSLTITATPNDVNAVMAGDANKALSLVVGDNPFEINVTAEDGTSNTYTITITRATPSVVESSDTSLASLTLSSGSLSPSLSASVQNYTASVANDVALLTIDAQATDLNASVTGDANKSLALVVGSNTFHISVTAEDGTLKTYTIVVTRAAPTSNVSDDATLSSLTLSSGSLSPSFTPNTTSYSASVGNDVTSLTVSAQANDASASVTGDINANTPLAVGMNTFEIEVMAEDGTTRKTYTILITRATPASVASDDATLQSLKPNSGTLSPSFDSSKKDYTIAVANNVTKIQFNALAKSGKATISGDGNKTLDLSEGENQFHIIVTAENGAKETYNVVVTRAKSDRKDPKIIQSSDKLISVSGNFDESYALISEAKTSEEVSVNESFTKDFVFEDIFDIYITKDGKRFDISEEVTVRIQLKEELKGKKDLRVAYIKDDGSYEFYPTTIYDEYVEFTTDHFSTYALVSANVQKAPVDVQTGDDVSTPLISFVFVSACVIFMIGLYSKRIREEE